MSKLSRVWRRLRQAAEERAGRGYELDGCRFTLPPWADDIKRNIRRGVYEAPERRLVQAWIDGKRPVIELGGAFGIVSGVIASRLDPSVAHVVVEADPRVAEFCRVNAAAPRPSGAPLSVVNAAVAYGADAVTFLPSEAFLGSRLALPGEGGGMTVPAVTLSALVGQHVGDAPYDLVCDIEGAEHEVFTLDAGALARCRTALVEVHSDLLAARGSSEAAFIARVEQLGFRVVARDENVLALRRPTEV